MDRADNANVIIAKGFKKKPCTSKGKRRIKSQLELSLGKSRKKNKRVKCMGYPALVGRDVYITQPMSSFTMDPISVFPQFTHPTNNASNMHNSMDVMYNPHTSYVALPIQGLSGQALSLHGYRYVEGTSNYNTCASAIQAANGQLNENEGSPISTYQQRTNTSSTDLSHVPDHEFVELVWDHGHITMQGQSSCQINSNYNPLK